ncbi:MAG: peptide chain release factor N(5)-glutamine methyltransferase [Alphaproteobacteria bacterium]|nr:peptide chain release factor N(5)-glutamine methyltransferase [Alphaproteobacteria bacterium]
MNPAADRSLDTTVETALRAAAKVLAGAGIDTARLDARLLLGHVLGREVWPHDSAALSVPDRRAFDALLARRLAHEPVSRILGRRGFWSLEFEVTPDTLVPRPDSETLIEAAIDAFADRTPPSRILDLGTGTGCLLLAALSVFPDARGLGLDSSAAAIAIARANAALNELTERAEFAIGNWSDVDCEPSDLILSNPPYIATPELAGLDPEVRDHDPSAALDGGPDGLGAYRSLSVVIPQFLASDGIAILELGAGQEAAVAQLMADTGLTVLGIRPDLAGTARALVLSFE